MARKRRHFSREYKAEVVQRCSIPAEYPTSPHRFAPSSTGAYHDDATANLALTNRYRGCRSRRTFSIGIDQRDHQGRPPRRPRSLSQEWRRGRRAFSFKLWPGHLKIILSISSGNDYDAAGEPFQREDDLYPSESVLAAHRPHKRTREAFSLASVARA